MSRAQLRAALDFLEAGNFRTGEAWENAHLICKAHESLPLFDWLHALTHRIEGDNANAESWYRRSGKTRHPGSIEEEWQIVRAAAEKS